MMDVKFEPHDITVGVSWDHRPDGLHIFLRLPCLVVHWQRRKRVVREIHAPGHPLRVETELGRQHAPNVVILPVGKPTVTLPHNAPLGTVYKFTDREGHQQP
jgi:hypothetical protein